MQGLVAQLTDELAVAQRDAGLVGDGLQQQDVVLVEAPDVPDPVGHDQRADDAGLAAQGHDDGVPHAVGGQPPARLGVAGAAGHEQRGPLGHHLPEHPEVFGVGRVLGPGEAPTGPEPDAGDDAAVGGHEGGRGPLGTQQFPRLPEQSAHDLLGLGGGAHRLAEAVEPLEVEVPVGERPVGPVRDEQQAAEGGQQPGAGR